MKATIVPHPTGGFTLAVPLSPGSTARVYQGWFPNKSAAERPLRQTNAKLRREFGRTTPVTRRHDLSPLLRRDGSLFAHALKQHAA